jgi:hypothetical protein
LKPRSTRRSTCSGTGTTNAGVPLSTSGRSRLSLSAKSVRRPYFSRRIAVDNGGAYAPAATAPSGSDVAAGKQGPHSSQNGATPRIGASHAAQWSGAMTRPSSRPARRSPHRARSSDCRMQTSRTTRAWVACQASASRRLNLPVPPLRAPRSVGYVDDRRARRRYRTFFGKALASSDAARERGADTSAAATRVHCSCLPPGAEPLRSAARPCGRDRLRQGPRPLLAMTEGPTTTFRPRGRRRHASKRRKSRATVMGNASGQFISRVRSCRSHDVAVRPS